VKTRKLKRSAHSLWLLQARRSDGAVWLQKRPAAGIWAGLYCLPVYESRDALAAALPPRVSLEDSPGFIHVLTHKDLHLHPVQASLSDAPAGEGSWFTREAWPMLGLPAPIRKLLLAA
jgi:A/G-specific adenine glycosylase